MKRILAILCLVAMCISLPAGIALGSEQAGSSLAVERISPEDGATNMAMDNMGFKVYFNEEIYSKDNNAANKSKFKILDPKGKEVPSIVLFSSKEKNLAMVLADTNNKKTKIKGKTKYSIEIDKEVVSADGNTMAKEFTSSFETLDPSSSMKISMAMMVVMIGAMIFFARKNVGDSEKREEAKKKEQRQKEKEKVNPYKVAKETGKSVEEIVAKDEKRKAKLAAKRERQKKENKVEIASDNFRVKGRQPISKAGVDYSAFKPAKAEPKPQQGNAGKGKNKNAKKKGKNKKK